MLNQLKRLLELLRPVKRLVDNPIVEVNLKTGKATPVEQTDKGKLFSLIAHNHCPKCDQDTDWLKGPEGGMSVNIKCEKCGWSYNVTVFPNGQGIAEDLGIRDSFGAQTQPKIVKS